MAVVASLSAAGTAFAMHRESPAKPPSVKRALPVLRIQRLGGHRIAVTTTLPTWANDYPWLGDPSQGYVGIHHDTTAPDGAWGFETNLGGNPGLWLYPIGDQRYVPGEAEFTYTAPGTTRLLSASLDIAYRNKVLAHHCLNLGLRTGDAIVDSNNHCQPVHPPDSQGEFHVDLADPNANPISKVLYLQLAMPPCQSGPCEKQIPALDPLKNGGYARLKSLRMVLVDDDKPGLLPEGELWDIRDTYINGSRAYGLVTNANDQGSGVARAWVERVGDGSVASGDAPCDPTHNTAELDNRICPATYTFQASIDTSSFPEGAQQFVEKAADVANNIGESPTWTVYIDRTPPPAAADLAVSAYDSQAQTTTVSWTAGDDPPLADGSPGSGVQSFSYRYNLNGTGWTDWSDTGEPDFQIENTALGDSIDVEVKSIDGAGNVSPVTSATLTVFAAGGPSDPYGSTTPDPGSTLSLTDAQQADAIQIAQSDPAVHALIGDRTTVASDVGPWSAPSGAVVGAQLTLSWDSPISAGGEWPFVDLGDDGVTYQQGTRTYSVSNLTQLDVRVDFGRGSVVSITPGVDAVVTSASAQPLAFGTKRFTAGGALALRRSAAVATATPVQEGAVNLRRITAKLYPAL